MIVEHVTQFCTSDWVDSSGTHNLSSKVSPVIQSTIQSSVQIRPQLGVATTFVPLKETIKGVACVQTSVSLKNAINDPVYRCVHLLHVENIYMFQFGTAEIAYNQHYQL